MSRRHDDLRFKGSIVPSRDPRHDVDPDIYYASRGGGGGSGGREELSLRSRQSVSPLNERGRRSMVRDPRSSSLERRRDYHQDIDRGRGGGSGGGGVFSRSPRIEHTQKRVHVDGRGFVVSPTNLDYFEYDEYSNNPNARARNTQSYEDIEVVNGKDYPARRSGASGLESVPFEEAVNRDIGSHPQYGYATKLVEPRGRNYHRIDDVHRVKDEKTRYQEAIPHEKMAKDVYYKDSEQSAYYARESPFMDSSISQIKDFGNEGVLKNSSNTSLVRGDYITKVRDGRTLPSEGYPKRYGKDFETLDSDDYGPYGHRIASESRRGYDEICRDAKCQACEAYKSSRIERKHHMYPEIGPRGDDEISYVSQEDMYTNIKYAREEHNPRDFVRQNIMDSNVESIANTEGSHPPRRIIKNVGAREYDAIQRDRALNYVDTRRASASYPLNQERDYLDSVYVYDELNRKVSNYRHTTDHGSLHEHEYEDPHLGDVYGRYEPAGSDRTRMKNSVDSKNIEMQRFSEGFERIKADEPLDNVRMLKRKYIVDEDVSRLETRGDIHSKWNIHSGNDDYQDYSTEVISRKANIMHPKRPSGYERDHYVESEDISDGSYHRNSTNVGWTSYRDQSENLKEHSGKPYKYGSRHFKGYTKPESSKIYSHVHHSHRSTHYKQQNLMQKYENDNSVAIPGQSADVLDDPEAPWKSDHSEDSDGFKQRIQTAFLDFSKRFNENPTARRLYKEDGKAGSLFCVVCRRSASKEFQNTKALAAHAFMSHKVGLRPHHLGLHRAICVLMGWNTMPDPDTATWAPEILPKPEAVAQKEDLILWPPVVIVHNISLSNNDHNKWKLINIEALEEFLRVKGFHLGKMKICLGNPGDHSVILVKFLGTFSGLLEAERLHKLFIERKHGRSDFNQAISGGGPADELMQGGDQPEKFEDVLLYGYMGISEDLDSIDFDTKKRCSVKSKKEIHEIADAPVKPE